MNRNLQTRMTELERKRGNIPERNPQREADMLTASRFFHANGEHYDMQPPSYFTKAEADALELVIWAQRLY